MAADRNMLLRALVYAAVKNAKAQGKKPADVLGEIILGHFNTSITDGKTVISTTEANGTTTFALASEMSPPEIVALAMEAVAWVESQADPENPNPIPRRIKRLRVSFAKAMTS